MVTELAVGVTREDFAAVATEELDGSVRSDHALIVGEEGNML